MTQKRQFNEFTKKALINDPTDSWNPPKAAQLQKAEIFKCHFRNILRMKGAFKSLYGRIQTTRVMNKGVPLSLKCAKMGAGY